MLLIGLTGGIATGKSSASDYLRSRQIPVIDADRIAQQVLQPGRPAYRKLIKILRKHGLHSQLLLKNGQIDRDWLSSLVFDTSPSTPITTIRDTITIPSSPNSIPSSSSSWSDTTTSKDHHSIEEVSYYRRLLNSCSHPYIAREIIRQISYYYLRRSPILVLDIPLLIELDLSKFVHRVLLINISDPELHLQRLLLRNPHLLRSQAESRIQAQLPLSIKLSHATDIIDNIHSKQYLYDHLDQLIMSWKTTISPLRRSSFFFIHRILSHVVYLCLLLPVTLVFLSLTILDYLNL
jgi:dephospho-CoA kinase